MNNREFSTARRVEYEDEPGVDGGSVPQEDGTKDDPQIGDTDQTRTDDDDEHLATQNGAITEHHEADGATANAGRDSADDRPSTAQIDPARIYDLVLAELRKHNCYWMQCVRCYKGASIDDALHDVMEELLNSLANDMTLRQGKKLPATEPGIVRYCLRRVRDRLSAPRNGEKRQRNLRDEHKDTIIDMQLLIGGGAVEHPFYDREFRIELINRASRDPNLHKLVNALMSCEYLPGTPDINSRQHKKLARYMNMTPSELRNAARRLDTLKNKLIEERNGRAEG